MNHSFDMRKIKMWSIVFALAFAITLLAVDVFFTFANMYVHQGYLMFNEDFYDTERYTNGILTATPVVSTAITAFLAVFITLAYCEQSKDIFIDKTEGAA